MRDGTDLKNNMCATGQASLICPMRSRLTRVVVTSTLHFSQITPRKLHPLVFAAQTS